MIKIVDYGLGNVAALLNVYKRLNIEAALARSDIELADASKLILPGVGAFDHAMESLDRSGMRSRLEELVLERRIPLLGVCVGMQILAKGSDEGSREGLGWVDGRVRGFASLDLPHLVLPHMGWNDVHPAEGEALFRSLETRARFYFLHSYLFECGCDESVIARSDYGISFACAIRASNIYGVQFHPEKSHSWGTQLLRNFAEL
jgi:glutamine amidotransferase